MANALDKLIIGLKPEPEPVAMATKPKPILVVKPMPVLSVTPQPVITINGNKAGVFVIKPKGGVIQ